MVVDIDLISVIFRLGLVPILLIMAIKFRSLYINLENSYFRGYFIFFTLIAITQFFVGLLELLDYYGVESAANLIGTTEFPGFQEHREFLGIVANMVRPNYLPIMIIVFIAIGSQVEPLEVMMKQEKRLLSKLLFIMVPLVALIYIPIITYTYYTIAVISIGYLLVFLGFFYNIVVSISLLIKTIGEIRKRTAKILVGFLLFMLGLVWSMKVGWSSFIHESFNLAHDVIFGDLLMAIGILFYYSVFSNSNKI